MPDAVTLKPILKLTEINHVGISSCMPVGSSFEWLFTHRQTLKMTPIVGPLEAAYSLNWGPMRFGERMDGRPWHFYYK